MKAVWVSSFLLFFFVRPASAQADVNGAWAGKLSVSGTSLRLVLNLQRTDSGYAATLDSPDQGAKDIKASKVGLTGDSLAVEISAANARLVGRFTTDSTFSGQWVQGVRLPLQLKKLPAGQTLAGPARPQTPKPPFPYKSEDLVYFNVDKTVQYGATLTVPTGSGPFPALLLLTGSGAQDRDETIFGHKPFAVLADYLTRRGYAVLRVDDRGVGQTTGDAANATSADFAADANLGLNYLKGRPEIDTTALGLLGHSEGGMIAQLVAADRKDIAFVVMLAAPGQAILDLMAEQNRAVLVKSGLSAEAATAYSRLYKPLAAAVAYAPTDTLAKLAARPVLEAWLKQTPASVAQATTGIGGEAEKTAAINGFVDVVRSPWFHYFIKYNPDTYLRRMKTKVLALNGENDIQVAAKPNLAALKASLQKGGNKDVETVELKGLNHLFQHCTKCTVGEYGELEETIAPEALEAIASWLERNVKKVASSQ